MEVVGKSKLRKDAIDKVTGKAKFIDDYKRGDVLYISTLRSPEPHIRILSIDTKKALSIDGVVRIITYKDIPGKNKIPLVFDDYPFLAEKLAKFKGQSIALVVAKTKEVADKAVKKIQLKYKKLPAVFDPLESIKKKSLKIFGKDNIFRTYKIRKGDIKEGFKKADVIIERTYRTNYQVHAYLEPQGMLAEMGIDGTVNIFGSMQCPFYVLDAVSAVLGIPQSKVRVVQATTGGAFGGKEDVPSIVAGHAALASYLTGRPVKLIYSREEDFESMSKRHPGWTKIKIGAKKNGKITAIKIKYILDSGAYVTLSPIVLWRGTVHAAGPYAIDNVWVDSFAVATNKVPCGAFRGFGQPQANFASESIIDELADILNINPLKIREINFIKKGKATMTGHKIRDSFGLDQVVRNVVKMSKFEKKWSHPEKKKGDIRKGIGIATTIYGVGLGAEGKFLEKAGAHVQIFKDGSVLIAVGNTEMGQGAFTVLTQIASETLGAPYEVVNIVEPDTTRVPDSGPTVASRTTVMSGNAIIDGCKIIRDRIDEVVRSVLKAKKEQKVVAKGGYYFIKGNPKRKIKYFDVIDECYKRRIHMSSQGYYKVKGTSFSRITGLGEPYFTYTTSCFVAEVEVDMKTGIVKILNFYSGHDIGKAVNPQQAEAQIQGGAVQGIGYAIYENLVVTEGSIITNNFTGYIIPTVRDVPDEIKAIIVEDRYKDGPYGAKGLGEPPLIGGAPAIANAIFNATGKRIRSLPILPEKIILNEE